MDIKITKVAKTELHHQYPGQHEKQPGQIVLDPETGELTAEYDPAIGPSGYRSMSEYHGRTRVYGLPGATWDGEAVNRLMEDMEALASRVCDGYETVWDGNNVVGRLDEDARAAEEQIEGMITKYADCADNYLRVWDAGDWFAGMGDDQVIQEYTITPGMTGEQIEEVARRMERDANADGIALLTDAEFYVESLSELMEEA